VVLYSGSERQPVGNVSVEWWVEQPNRFRFRERLKTDSAGRFSLEVPSNGLLRLYSRPDGLYQPCVTTVKVGQTETTIRLVAEADVLRARDWPDFQIDGVRSGTVFETSSTAVIPVPGALVQVDGVFGDGVPLSDTLSDANGRFVVCGLEGHPWHALVASKANRLGIELIPVQGTGPLDIELNRSIGSSP
jgi:hypothetical protein